MTSKEKKYLKKICERCKKAYGKCIKYDPYIGLCAETDVQDLIDAAKRRGVLK